MQRYRAQQQLAANNRLCCIHIPCQCRFVHIIIAHSLQSHIMVFVRFDVDAPAPAEFDVHRSALMRMTAYG